MRGARIIWGVVIVSISLLACTRTRVEGERAECLEPPWSASSGSVSTVGAVSCENPRYFGVVLPGETLADDDAALKFLDAHRDEIHALDGVVGSGLGVCCGTMDWDDHCISVTILLCRQRADDLIAKFRAFQASSDETKNVSFKLTFELEGALDPRCEPGPTCTAVPYDSSFGATPPATRELVQLPPSFNTIGAGPSCTHDGECQPIGSGNECGHWTESGISGSDIGITALEDAFCGCVQGTCEWFH